MNEENKPKGIYLKLLKIQQSILGLGKDKKSFGYDYVTGTKVLEHVKPLMNDLGLLLKQEVISSTNIRMDYQVKSGAKTEILTKLDMRFTWIDCESGETDENLFGANGQNDFEKGYGSALTYGERYFLLKFFHIATDEDDIDNPDRKPEDKNVHQTAPTQTAPPSNTIPTEPELPWLNKTDKENWEKVVSAMKGGFTIAQVRKKWAVSKKTEGELNEAIK